MLGGARPVVALDARRRPPPLADGPDSVAPLAAPAYALARATRRRGCAGVCCFEVRTEWLADCRARDGAVDAADAVSSAFLRACDADVGFLGVDVRSRGLGCGPDDAGNHERVVVTRGPADDGTPTLVRRACGGLRGASRSPPPSAWSLLTATFAAAHDWTRPDAPASRARRAETTRRAPGYDASLGLAGCEEALHLPILDVDAAHCSTCIAFSPARGATAFLAAGPGAGRGRELPNLQRLLARPLSTRFG